MKSFVYLHVGMVRSRVIGSGNLDLHLSGYNDIESEDLIPIAINATEKRQRDRLCNFTGQAVKLKVSMNEIDEWFNINDLTIFAKELWASAPMVD